MTRAKTTATTAMAMTLAMGCGVPDMGWEATLVDPNAPWTPHTVYRVPPGQAAGADGTDVRGDFDGDGLPDVVSAWEQRNVLTLSLHPPISVDPRTVASWETVELPGNPACEDVRAGDMDGDGVPDLVSSCSSGHVAVSFAPAVTAMLMAPGAWTRVVLPVSLGHARWMQSAVSDYDGDGDLDIVAGGYAGTAANPAEVSLFLNPGCADSRDGSLWTRTRLSLAGWTMGLEARDVTGDGLDDIVTSDRTSYRDAGNVARWDLYGGRWMANPGVGGGVWVNRPITPPAGGCAACTPGDEMMFGLGSDGSFNDGQSSKSGATGGRLTTMTNSDPLHWTGTWTRSPVGITDPLAGRYQSSAMGDLDGDGITDRLVTTYDAVAPKRGVYWVNGATGAFGNVSGPTPTGAIGKFDDADLLDIDGDGDLDVMTSEQLQAPQQLGVVWYENPSVP